MGPHIPEKIENKYRKMSRRRERQGVDSLQDEASWCIPFVFIQQASMSQSSFLAPITWLLSEKLKENIPTPRDGGNSLHSLLGETDGKGKEVRLVIPRYASGTLWLPSSEIVFLEESLSNTNDNITDVTEIPFSILWHLINRCQRHPELDRTGDVSIHLPERRLTAQPTLVFLRIPTKVSLIREGSWNASIRF